MTHKELVPYLSSETLTDTYLTIELHNIDALGRALERPAGDMPLYKSVEDTLPPPLGTADIRYARTTGEHLRLYGTIGFDPSTFETDEDAAQWQTSIRQGMIDELKKIGLEYSTRAYDITSLIIEGIDGRHICIRTAAYDWQECTVEIELLPPEAAPAQDGDNPADDLAQLRMFTQVWKIAFNTLLEKYHGAPMSTPIIVAAPIDAAIDTTTDTLPIPTAAPEIETITSPEMGFNIIGGLSSVKPTLESMVLAFRKPDAAELYGVKCNPILLYGPPGTGKTSIAEAYAYEAGATFTPINSTDIIDKWVGNSGKAVQGVFDRAKEHAGRIVIFLDEFDSLASRNSSETSERADVKSVLKRELISLPPHVTVIAATNVDPQKLDEALVRSGRFEPIHIPKPNETDRVEIWSAVLVNSIRDITGKGEMSVGPGGELSQPFIPYSSSIDPTELASLTNDMTGADFVEILRRARVKHFRQYIATDSLERGRVSQADLIAEIQQFRR